MSSLRMSFDQSDDLNANFTESNTLYAGFATDGCYYSNVSVGTTEEWNSKPSLIGAKNVVYVYTDHEFDGDGQPIPGFKVGDGLAYLIDLPFNDALMVTHINNQLIHVSDEERAFWNNKVSAYLDADNQEKLVLTTD